MKKTIIEMIEKCNGGKAAVAGFLGLSEAGLNNRLYQTKGQRFTTEELIAIQQEFGVTDFTQELCRQVGGVFVPLPNADELDSVEIAEIQRHELSVRGLLFVELEKALADGEISAEEEMLIRKILNKHLSATHQAIDSVIVLNRK